MTQDQFRRAAGLSAEFAARWFQYIVAAMAEFGITDKAAKAMFIAQIGHESAGFTQLSESFNYSPAGLVSTFGKRITANQASMLGRQRGEKAVPQNRQVAIANLVYQGRYGNSASGDGWKYRGRGLKQVTFLANYLACGKELKIDLVSNPDLLLIDENAARSAGWFWRANNCGKWASDIVRVTQIVNGGQNGIKERAGLFEQAKKVLL
jgi:putative chitinase